jgi:hypothetical protein
MEMNEMSQTNENDAVITVHRDDFSDPEQLCNKLADLFGYSGAVLVLGNSDQCVVGFHGFTPFKIHQIANALEDVGLEFGKQIAADYIAAHPGFVLPESQYDLPQDLADLLGRPDPEEQIV